MTRKQKIQLLKSVAKGEISLSEIEPATYEIWMCTDGEAYFNNKTGESIAIDEYNKRFSKSMSITLNIE